MLIESSSNLPLAGNQNHSGDKETCITQRMTQSQAELVLIALYVLDHQIEITADLQPNAAVSAALRFFGIRKMPCTDSDKGFGILIDGIFDKLMEQGLLNADIEENPLGDDDTQEIFSNIGINRNLMSETEGV